MRVDIGIIGALSEEVEGLISKMDSHACELVGAIEFHTGVLSGKSIAVAKCGVGKVFAAMCAEAMIIRYSPSLIINTGVGGALDSQLSTGDIVIADKLCQHDMDTSPLGDPKGLISGINVIYMHSDERAIKLLMNAGERLSCRVTRGTVASGDKFIACKSEKDRIVGEFGAIACEMEGAAIAQVAYVNKTPFVVVRAISDSADGEATMDYMTFLPIAAERSAGLTLDLIKNY